MTRQRFDADLAALKQEILKMGSLVEEAVDSAVKSLAGQNLEQADQVIERDSVIDRMEVELEEQCMRLIALQQPLAKDLRVIGTVLKTITDIERIGDHAANIAEITLRIGNEPLIKPLIDIPRMARMAQEMVRQALDSFVREDAGLAAQVVEKDDPVDQLYSALFDELMGFVLEGGDVKRATQAINLLFAARYLERVADHATNIAERVIYMVTGRRVSHTGHVKGQLHN